MARNWPGGKDRDRTRPPAPQRVLEDTGGRGDHHGGQAMVRSISRGLLRVHQELIDDLAEFRKGKGLGQG